MLDHRSMPWGGKKKYDSPYRMMKQAICGFAISTGFKTTPIKRILELMEAEVLWYCRTWKVPYTKGLRAIMLREFSYYFRHHKYQDPGSMRLLELELLTQEWQEKGWI